MDVILPEAFPKGANDFSAHLTKIKSLNPDVLAAATYFDDAVALTRQMRELDVNPRAYGVTVGGDLRSEEHTSELQSHLNLVCRLLLEKKQNDAQGHSVMLTNRHRHG